MDVHHIFDVFRVPEGKFNRLNLASLTTATNYFRPTRILYYIDLLSEVASLFLYYCISLDLFESNNKKCNFLELNVSFLQLFKYCQRKTPPTTFQIHSYHLIDLSYYERVLHIWGFASGI